MLSTKRIRPVTTNVFMCYSPNEKRCPLDCTVYNVRSRQACEDEIAIRCSGMPTQSHTPVKDDRTQSHTPVKDDRANSHTPVKSDFNQSNDPKEIPTKLRQHNHSHDRRILSPLPPSSSSSSSYADNGRSNYYGIKRQGGRTKVNSLLRSPTSH